MMEIGLAPAAQWYSLFFNQLQMWLNYQAGAGRAAYSVPAVDELCRRLDVDALPTSKQILHKHGIQFMTRTFVLEQPR